VQRDRDVASGDLCRESVPLSQGSRASMLVDLPRDEMALLIELVVHLTSKALHRPFASPKRLMGILCAIVEPTADLVPLRGNTDLAHRRRICPKPIGDDAVRSPVFLHDPLEKFERCSLVPAVTTASKTSLS
jgi:hypothetical protein